MRSLHLPFNISTTLVLFILLFSAQSIFAQWIQQNGPVAYGAQFVTFLNQSTGYVQPVYDTTLLKTTNSGINWIKTTSRYSSQKTRIINDSTLVRLTSIGNPYTYCIVKTTNSGTNWQIIYTAPTTYSLFDIFFVNELTGWIGGRINTQFADTAVVWRTTNGGQSFEQQLTKYNGASFPILFFSKDSVNGKYWGFAILANGYGKITTNSGESWSDYQYFASTYPTMKIKFWDRSIGFLSNHSGPRLFKTTNAGLNWITLTLPSNLYGFYTVYDFKVIDPNGLIYCVGGEQTGSGGFIWKSTNGGANWRIQNFDSTSHPGNAWAVDFVNSDTGWVFCNGGTTFKTTNGGGTSILLDVNQNGNTIPYKFYLSQNYPNPFNPTTKINFDLKNAAFAILRVYDITGREVRTLVNEKLSAGSYSYDFNASELPSGVYFYQLQAEGFIETKKMILLK